MEKTLNQMSAEEKQDAAFTKLLTPKDPRGNDLVFRSPEAGQNYRASITRIRDAIRLKEADRVPVTLFPSMFPVTHYGITVEEAMYDYDKCVDAFRKYTLEFKPDLQWGATGPGPGKFYEILDYKLYAWPGHGVDPSHSYQCLEGEYMKAEEYDLLLTDPSLFFRNFYLPRVFGSLEGFRMLPPLTGILEMYGLAFSFIPYGLPPVQQTYKALFDAGAEAMKWAGAMGALDGELASLGYPAILGGYTKAPFDTLGDTLRGTKGIMLDIYRRPDILLKALDAITPIMIGMGIASAQQTGNPLIFIPLHKGADGFLSDEQFKQFYWPFLQKVIIGLIEGGCVPFLAAEGGYDSRLEIIKDIPKGRTMWMFDQTDIIKAKKIVGDSLCIFGNVPSSMLELGSVAEVTDYVKKMIDEVAPGGGFVMANGSFFDNARPENLTAIIETTREYGKY
jgi:uroporphyrinogen-III decarboxylase